MALVIWKAPDQATAEGGEESQAAAPTPGSAAGAEPTSGPDSPWVLGAYGLIAGAAVGGWLLYESIEPAAYSPSAELTAFAPLYILAQSIERLLEPLSKYLGATKEGGKEKAEQKREEAFGLLARAPTANAAVAAATAHALVERIRRNTTVIAWGLASALAMLACGAFGIRLLSAIGFDVPAFWDIAITGLAVGSGTKPLHDLISNLQKAKDSKANPPGAATVD